MAIYVFRAPSHWAPFLVSKGSKLGGVFPRMRGARSLGLPAEPVASDEYGSERRIRHRECRCKSAGGSMRC